MLMAMTQPLNRKRLTREQSRAETRQRLLDSAYELISRNGVEAVAIEEIAESAGYSRGAFYSNFESKEELLMELLEREIERSHEEVTRILLENATPLERVQGVRAYYLNFGRDRHGCMFYLEMQLYALRHPQVQLAWKALFEKDRLFIVEFVRKLYAESGFEAPASPEILTSGFIALTMGLTLYQMLSTCAEDISFSEQALTAFFDGMVTKPMMEQLGLSANLKSTAFDQETRKPASDGS